MLSCLLCMLPFNTKCNTIDIPCTLLPSMCNSVLCVKSLFFFPFGCYSISWAGQELAPTGEHSLRCRYLWTCSVVFFHPDFLHGRKGHKTPFSSRKSALTPAFQGGHKDGGIWHQRKWNGEKHQCSHVTLGHAKSSFRSSTISTECQHACTSIHAYYSPSHKVLPLQAHWTDSGPRGKTRPLEDSIVQHPICEGKDDWMGAHMTCHVTCHLFLQEGVLPIATECQGDGRTRSSSAQFFADREGWSYAFGTTSSALSCILTTLFKWWCSKFWDRHFTAGWSQSAR